MVSKYTWTPTWPYSNVALSCWLIERCVCSWCFVVHLMLLSIKIKCFIKWNHWGIQSDFVIHRVGRYCLMATILENNGHGGEVNFANDILKSTTSFLPLRHTKWLLSLAYWQIFGNGGTLGKWLPRAKIYYAIILSECRLWYLSWLFCVIYQGHINNKKLKMNFVIHILEKIAQWRQFL